LYQVAAKRAEISKPRSSRSSKSLSLREGGSTLAIWVFAVAILLSSILCVWSRAKVISLGYEISRASRQLHELRDANDKLIGEVAMLKAPGRLEAIAKKRLGLFPPKNNQIVFIK